MWRLRKNSVCPILIDLLVPAQETGCLKGNQIPVDIIKVVVFYLIPFIHLFIL